MSLSKDELSDAIASGIIKGLTAFTVGAALIIWVLDFLRRMIFH